MFIRSRLMSRLSIPLMPNRGLRAPRSFIVEEVPVCYQPKKDILALGTDTRQRVSFSSGGRVFELKPVCNFACCEDFYSAAGRFLSRKIKKGFDLISFDPHPLFASNAFSKVIQHKYFPKAQLLPVWHHVAHVASFINELNINRSFIGIAFDGTGYGSDGCVWGGEFFVYRNKEFKRRAHFKYQPLCGNELAIKEPWRFAFGILYGIYGFESFPFDLVCFRGIQKSSFKMLAEMIDKRFNTPLVSSAGRLFDAAAALLNLKTVVSKEAEAAVSLEEAAARYKGANVKPYDFTIKKQNGNFLVVADPMFKNIVSDLRSHETQEKIAFRFHMTLAEITRRVSLFLSREYGVKNVYCSGGVFMNNILCSRMKDLFRSEDLKLYFAQPPLNTDLGIARGQIAACVMEALCV